MAITKNSQIDLNGNEMILDADGDTTITADTDDQIDFKTGGTDRFTIDASGDVSISVGKLTTSGANGADNQGINITDTGYSKTHKLYGDNSLHIQADSGQSILMKPNASEIARFTSDGLTFNGDTAAANALDDYEEGVWTPTINGGTINTIYSAKYTKIGNVVHYYVYLLLSFVNNSNRFEISVPFNTSSVTTETYPVGAIGYSGSMNTQDFRPHVHKNSNPGFIYFHEVDGNATQVTNATMYARNYNDGRVTALIVSGSYYTE